MKFGVSLWLWTAPVTNEVIEEYAPKIANLGFDTVEIPLEDPAELDCDRARKAVEENGLTLTTCAAMGGGRDLVHPDKSVRDAGMKYMKDSLDAAEKLGSKLFVGPLASEVGRLWESDETQRKSEIKLLVSQLNEVADYAASKNITVCLEALNRFETSFLNLTSQVCDVIDRVNILIAR